MNDWDFKFLGLAREVSTWSKDPSTKVGAVAVRNKHLYSFY
jgi:dCMP deaminase